MDPNVVSTMGQGEAMKLMKKSKKKIEIEIKVDIIHLLYSPESLSQA